MRVAEGDIIGTKDGRYGVVEFIVTQDRFLVLEAFPPDAPCADVMPNQFWTGIKNVASIV